MELSSSYKLGLYVGRRGDQTVPKEEGWKWISLDPLDYSEKLEEGRIHFAFRLGSQLNCFDNKFGDDLLNKMEGIFTKVMVDTNTLKFLGNDSWKDLHRYLKKEISSMLLCETVSHQAYNPQIKEEYLLWYESNVGDDQKENDQKEYQSYFNNSGKNKFDDWLWSKKEERENMKILQTLFNVVKIVDLKEHPFLYNGFYFEASDPK